MQKTTTNQNLFGKLLKGFRNGFGGIFQSSEKRRFLKLKQFIA
jgi:hypothetical protein